MSEKCNEKDLAITQWEVKYKEIELKLTAFQNDQSQKNYIEKIEKEKQEQRDHVQKLENELKEAKAKAAAVEEKAKKAEHNYAELKNSHSTTPSHTTPTTLQVKETPKSEYKEPEKVEKGEEKRKGSSAPRPSAIPGSVAGKPAPEDWLIKVNIIKAVNLKPVALLGDIDPFCEVIVQQFISLTKTIAQTKNPEWNHKLNFFGDKGTPLPEKLKLVVRDSNKFTASALVGEAEIDLKPLWEKGTGYDNTVELQNKAKPAGKLTLQISALFETAGES